MLAGNMGAENSSSCGQISNPGYGALHVMPPHLTNTHNCCPAALDKENVLTAVAAEEISRLVPRATLLQGTGRSDLLLQAKKTATAAQVILQQDLGKVGKNC